MHLLLKKIAENHLQLILADNLSFAETTIFCGASQLTPKN